MAVDPPLEPTVRAVQALSPQGQEMAVTVVRQLEQKVAINVPLGPGQRFEAPLFFPMSTMPRGDSDSCSGWFCDS